MNLIYARNYASARTFALHHDLMPGDWTWISDARVLRQHARADVYVAPEWQAHPQRAQIDLALRQAARDHRLGALNDCSSESGGAFGVSGA